MTSRFGKYWQQLRESLWFVPTLMMLSALGLAYGLVTVDVHSAWAGEKQFPWLFGVGSEGSRGMLTAIAGSMLTVTALTFSLTLSAISQVSSQYSPRVLRNFMRDRINQVVMGYFVGVFTYSLTVLGTIRGTDEQKFVPATAVLMGLLLALGGVAALILFIHHIAESLQTGTILRHIFRETTHAIDQLFPNQLGKPVDNPHQLEAAQCYINEPTGWHPLAARRTGYLQRIDTEGLLRWAERYRVIVRMEQKMGAFVSETTVLCSIRPDKEQTVPSQAEWPHDPMEYVTVGPHRSIEQDVAFGIQQLVDIVLKALSPGINDTTTAIMAVDYLGAICARLAQRELASQPRTDGRQLRVIIRVTDFAHYIRLTFDLPRINARSNHAVLCRLVASLATVAQTVYSTDRKAAIQKQAQRLKKYAEQTLSTDYEKEQVRELYETLKSDWE